MLQVHLNGSVSYSAFEGGAFRRKPLVYAEYTGTIRHENFEPNYKFAGHMSLRKAFAEYPDEARQTLIDEIDGILKLEVWTGVVKTSLTAAQLKLALRSNAIVKQKYDLLGNHIKCKVRLVADGRSEDRTLFKEDDIASPTVSVSSLLTVSTVAAAEGRKVVTMDVSQAYLNAKMKEVVHMRLSPPVAKILIKRDPS